MSTDAADSLRVLGYGFAAQLQQGASDDSEKRATLISALESYFNFSLSSVDDFTNLALVGSSASTVTDVFSSGLEAVGAKPYCEGLREVTENPKFEPFVESVSKKGYFANTEEGSMEYLQRHAKVVTKFMEKMNVKMSAASKAESEKIAEEKKLEGNKAITAKDYASAVTYYTEAIELSSDGPNSHIYFTNRAAAHCYLRNYQSAVADCERSIALAPDYVKAYSRLGLANFFMERYEKAVEAYQVAVDLEPDNKASRDSLRQAKQKVEECSGGERKRTSASSSSSGARTAGTQPGGAPGGLPDFGALADMMGGGGPDGLAGLMQNPGQS